MTEALILFATTINALLMVLGASNNTPTAKIMVIGLTMGSLILHLVGRAITAPQRLRVAWAEVLVAWWPLMLLSVYVIGGSLYARLGEKINETFVGFGIGMLFLPLVATAVRSSAKPLVLLKGAATIYTLLVLGMMVMLALGRGVFHEEVFITVPLAGYFLSARPMRAWRLLLGFALLAVCLLSFKNTTFLMVLTTLSACAILWVARLTQLGSSLKRFTGMYFGLLGVLLVFAGIAFAWWTYRSYLPSGNTQYRTEMYGIAWRRFLDSPLWGSAFTDSSVNFFELYQIDSPTQTLPTHSDVVDLLGHGGLIAIGLWVTAVWRLMKIAIASLRQIASVRVPSNIVAWRWLFVLALVEIGAVVTYALNPLLHRPVHGFWIWGGLGALWALHRQLTVGAWPSAAPASRTQPAGAYA